MATITIADTKIGTSDPGNTGSLNICAGIPLIGNLSLPLGWQLKHVGGVSASHAFKVVAVKASASYGFNIGAGICGPAYAIQFNATNGTITDDTISLTVTEDEAICGTYFGVGLGANVSLSASVYKVWKWKWSSVLSAELSVQADLLKFAWDALSILTPSLIDLPEVPSTVLATASVAGENTPVTVAGESSDAFASGNGVIETSFTLSAPINVWSLLVYAAELAEVIPYVDIGTTAFLAFDKGVRLTLSSIGFGPVFAVRFPVEIQIKSVAVDGVVFNKTTVTGGDWQGKLADPTAVVPATPTKLDVTLEHQLSATLQLGLYVELQLVELFHIGAKAMFDLFPAFKLPPAVGTFTHDLSNTIGNTEVASASPCGCDGVDLIDVRFT